MQSRKALNGVAHALASAELHASISLCVGGGSLGHLPCVEHVIPLSEIPCAEPHAAIVTATATPKIQTPTRIENLP
jgi:hypothetical protein